MSRKGKTQDAAAREGTGSPARFHATPMPDLREDVHRALPTVLL